MPLDGGADYAEYEDLKGYEAAGKPAYFSGKLRKDFPIAGLLDGLEDAGRRASQPQPKVNIFVSYSHKYPEHKANLLTHLSVYTRAGKVNVWDDGRLVAGQEWKKELWKRHAEADIVLCLMSAAFIDSEYCYDQEFGEAIKAMENDTKDVVPILVEQFAYELLEPISKLQIIPEKRAVANYKNENNAWTNVMRSLAPVVEKWIERKRKAGKRDWDGR